ncbi:YlbF family regulator [Candidatus Palauibacter sp.]|uniref:YlbF family regulator n=1 Tax=Candidatus Palauibacter sp. TaxID=3101350 RepID=UPI003B02BD5F
MDERDRMLEKAREVGRIISQLPEYAYLRAARREIDADREATEMLNRMRDLQQALMQAISRGETASEEQEREFGDLQEKIQTNARYQAFISSQANFEKLMDRVDHAIGEGIRKGEESRIILAT